MTFARIPQSIVVANGKGGVGKTTVTANLAVAAAQRGRPVIAVDLDPQANLATEFGVEDHDEGKSLLAAAMDLGDLMLHPAHREGLSYVAAGVHTARLADMAFLESKGDPNALAAMLAKVLAPVVEETGAQLFFDTPPSAGSLLADAALQLGEWLLIPTKDDVNSLDGVPTMLARILELANGHREQSMIKPIGVLLFGLNHQAKVINRDTRAELEDALDGAFPVLEATVRHAGKAQRDAKMGGLVASEYAEMATHTEVMPWYEALKKGVKQRITFASNADDVATDYTELYAEVARIVEETPKVGGVV